MSYPARAEGLGKYDKYAVEMSNSSIWPIGTTLLDAATSGQSGPKSDGTEEVLYIPQSSCVSEASQSICLVSYTGHSLAGVGLTPLQRSSRYLLQSQPTGADVLYDKF